VALPGGGGRARPGCGFGTGLRDAHHGGRVGVVLESPYDPTTSGRRRRITAGNPLVALTGMAGEDALIEVFREVIDAQIKNEVIGLLTVLRESPSPESQAHAILRFVRRDVPRNRLKA